MKKNVTAELVVLLRVNVHQKQLPRSASRIRESRTRTLVSRFPKKEMKENQKILGFGALVLLAAVFGFVLCNFVVF